MGLEEESGVAEVGKGGCAISTLAPAFYLDPIAAARKSSPKGR
jgi:hypothetical protein